MPQKLAVPPQIKKILLPFPVTLFGSSVTSSSCLSLSCLWASSSIWFSLGSATVTSLDVHDLKLHMWGAYCSPFSAGNILSSSAYTASVLFLPLYPFFLDCEFITELKYLLFLMLSPFDFYAIIVFNKLF